MLALLAFEDVEAAQRAPLVHEQPDTRAAHVQRVRGELHRRLEHLQQAAVGADAHAGEREPRLLLGPPTILGVLDRAMLGHPAVVTHPAGAAVRAARASAPPDHAIALLLEAGFDEALLDRIGLAGAEQPAQEASRAAHPGADGGAAAGVSDDRAADRADGAPPLRRRSRRDPGAGLAS